MNLAQRITKGIAKLSHYSESMFNVVPKSKRTRLFRLQITRRHELRITLRKFHTRKENRSKKFTQYVIHVDTLDGIKEIAIRYVAIPRRTQHYSIRRENWLPKPSYSYAITLLGIAGIVFFSLRLIPVVTNRIYIAQAEDLLIRSESSIYSRTEVPIFYPKSIPTKIEIPAIGVSRQMQQMGLLADGSMETPEVMSGAVGWYSYSPSPGEVGPSIMVAHVDTYEGPSVFWNLSKLNVGSDIIIYREDGTRLIFAVSKVEQYSQDSFPTEAVYGNVDHASVRIITCGGTFNYLTGRYSANTVVYGDMKTGSLASLN